MATAPNSIPASAQQPGLRSFIVYDDLPEGGVVVEITCDTAPPFVKKGDFVIADTSQREPISGELFAVEWGDGSREVVELKIRGGYYGNRGQAAPFEYGYRWYIRVHSPIAAPFSGKAISAYQADGPYDAEHLKEKIVGRVIGFYEPDFRNWFRRLAA